jgi:hypothetical protein
MFAARAGAYLRPARRLGHDVRSAGVLADRAGGLSSVAAPFALRTDGELAISFSEIRLAHAAVRQCRSGVELE